MKKIYFITGGTGSFAKNLIKYLLKNRLSKKIIIYSRDEYKQLQLKEDNLINKNLSQIRFLIGDVRDEDRLNFAIQEEIDTVIHSAAMKQVPATEYNPFEAIKTNILGAQNVIQSCINKNIKKIIALKY